MYKLQNCDQRSNTPDYSGNYIHSQGTDILRRKDDGLILHLCRSKRSGCPPYYVRDITNNRFLSSLYNEHQYPQFETKPPEKVRYEVVPVSGENYKIQAVDTRGRK